MLGFTVHDLGQRGYAIGFIVFVFLAMFGLGVVWVLKYSREDARLPARPPAADEDQLHEELQHVR